MGKRDKLIENVKDEIAKDRASLAFNDLQEAHGPQPNEVAEESAELRQRIAEKEKFKEHCEKDND